MKVKKLPKKRARINFQLVYIFLAILFSLLIFWFVKNNNAPITLTTHCDQASTVINLVKQELANQKITSSDETNNSNSLTLDWKRKFGEPFVFYKAQVNLNIATLNSTPEKIYSLLNQNTYPNLASQGFLPNPLNNLSLTKNANTGVLNARLAFVKNNDIYLISLLSNSQISIKCGTQNPQYDQIYDQVIANSQISQDSEIAILDLQNNMAKISITGFQTVGGTIENWTLVGSSWKKI